MGLAKTEYYTFKCDRCGKAKQVDQDRLPKDHTYAAWAELSWHQDSGFDAGGAPWCNRLKGPIHLCSECAEYIWNDIFLSKENIDAAKNKKAEPDAPNR